MYQKWPLPQNSPVVLGTLCIWGRAEFLYMTLLISCSTPFAEARSQQILFPNASRENVGLLDLQGHKLGISCPLQMNWITLSGAGGITNPKKYQVKQAGKVPGLSLPFSLFCFGCPGVCPPPHPLHMSSQQ